MVRRCITFAGTRVGQRVAVEVLEALPSDAPIVIIQQAAETMGSPPSRGKE
jgi:hypothetical protein